MADPNLLPPWMFNLDGTFVDFLGDDPTTAKLIRLEVEGELLAIKLRKELRGPWRSHLQPGDRLHCIGRSQLDSKTGVIKLKAYQVLTLPSLQPTSDRPSIPAMPTPCTPPLPAQHIKLQVCRKSGCQKRGGQKLVTALKQALRDRNLHHQVEIQYTGCQKRCSDAPTLTVMPGRHRYNQVKLPQLSALIDRHLNPRSSKVQGGG
ncbi:MAG: (2Fe-2S) ferredoxin domain-containing protein [Leptolyngbya sp. DLM2.Bin15]|nr:MAG: (2Fe-2S) ferredoxin domain-containing protein [Leptolyngbya sp. DLM2.Bin15]